MIKTQIQLPDHLYRQAKAIAAQREWSLAEVFRRGIEHMLLLYPVREKSAKWQLPILKAQAFSSDFDHLDFKALAEAEELGASR